MFLLSDQSAYTNRRHTRMLKYKNGIQKGTGYQRFFFKLLVLEHSISPHQDPAIDISLNVKPT